MTDQPQDQGDRLMWMLGGAVAVVALVSIALVLWPAQDVGAPGAPAPITTAIVDTPPPAPPAPAAGGNTPTQSRLNRAQLALDAGMLLEPEGFSAWSLYSAILENEPDHAAAATGLAAVADALASRARLAVSEGRDGQADALVARVLERFPTHVEALAIRDRERAPPAEVAPRPPAPLRPQAAPPPQPVVDVAPPPSRQPAIDLSIARGERVIEMYPEFTRALAAGALIAPPERNAEHFVNEMRAIDPVHPMTRDAEQQLFDAIFARHDAAFDALDTSAAIEWLAAADRMSVDAARVAAARQTIIDFITQRAANERIPASSLTMTSYEAPEYPIGAQRRGVGGWVDVEFLVGVDGTPRDVSATDSSHSMFEQAAIEAVSQWRFEPHRITGRPVEQWAQTRIRFVIE